MSDQQTVNILLVDDEPNNLLALDVILASDDRRLVHAASGEEALRQLLRDDFAVILLDVRMPGLDGFETARLIRGRERSWDTPIIFLTAALLDEPAISRGYALGAVDYIAKPINAEMLRSKVTVFVELFRKTQQIKQQAQQLAETTAFLNNVLESTTEYAIGAMNLSGTYLTWNEGARRLYGYSPDEVIGQKRAHQLHTPEDLASGRVDELFKTAARTGKAEGEFERIRKNGRRFTASVILHRRRDSGGATIGYVSISRDVTALRRAERERAQLLEAQAARAAAEAARDRLQQVVDVLPLGLALADAEGTIYLSNAAAQTMLGQAPLSAAPNPADRFQILLLDGTPCPADQLPLTRAVFHGEVVRDEQLLLCSGDPDQPRLPILVNAAPLKGPGGAIVGGVVAFLDITAIKELEQQKDAFLAAVSHDLRNPLTSIKARAQLLQRRLSKLGSAEGAPLRDGLQAIDQVASRVTVMINELLDVARLEAGRPLDLDLQPMDLLDLANQVVAELRPAAERHQVEVVAETPALVGDWDRARLERVLMNLVSNAIKYSPEGGPVRLELRPVEQDGAGWAVLRVCDRGIGIPAADLPRIFDRFYRGSNVTGRIQGTGLGVSGARQVVEQHGGRIEAESVEGVGSTFTVWLPLEADQPAD